MRNAEKQAHLAFANRIDPTDDTVNMNMISFHIVTVL